MNERLLDIVCCPVSHQDLRKADSALLATLNRRIEAGTLLNESGDVPAAPLQAALVTMDGRRVYPVSDGLVALLEAESLVIDDDA